MIKDMVAKVPCIKLAAELEASARAYFETNHGKMEEAHAEDALKTQHIDFRRPTTVRMGSLAWVFERLARKRPVVAQTGCPQTQPQWSALMDSVVLFRPMLDAVGGVQDRAYWVPENVLRLVYDARDVMAEMAAGVPKFEHLKKDAGLALQIIEDRIAKNFSSDLYQITMLVSPAWMQMNPRTWNAAARKEAKRLWWSYMKPWRARRSLEELDEEVGNAQLGVHLINKDRGGDQSTYWARLTGTADVGEISEFNQSVIDLCLGEPAVELSFKIAKLLLWRRNTIHKDLLLALTRIAFHYEHMAHPLRKLLQKPSEEQRQLMMEGRYAKALRDCAVAKAAM